MKHARVRNWEKFQHYKDRNPPWVKLYTSWPEDYEWSQWTDASKLLAVCILMLASRSGNRIPLDPKWIQQRFSLQRLPDLKPLLAVQFLEEIQELPAPEQNASDVLADCKQDASPRALAREETEKRRDRGETETEGACAPGLDAAAWKRWIEYRIEIRKPIKPVSMQAAQRELSGFGCDQAAVVERSVAAGWQGLFPLKLRPNGALTKPHREAPTTEELEAREAARGRS